MYRQIKKKPCGFEAARLDKQVIGHNALTDKDIITKNKNLHKGYRCKDFNLRLDRVEQRMDECIEIAIKILRLAIEDLKNRQQNLY